ncbi:MAG: spermidine synthase [Candidatus Limnocylindrales bacterium]
MIARPLLPAVPIPERLRLVLLAFLVLFVELALIRWTGSNVVYLSFFSNFVLLGSFLGIGIGFLRAKAVLNLFPYSPVALAFLIGFVLIFPVQIDRSGSELIFFGALETTGLPTWVMLPVMFLAIAGVMATLAEGLARQFVRFEALEAYRLDIVGSILGIVGFSAISFLGAPPIAWGLVAALAFVILMPPYLRVLQVVALVGFVFMLGRESFTPGYSWSPYYRIGVREIEEGVHGVGVNSIPHQIILPVDRMTDIEPLYEVPYERSSQQPENVLVVGAGTGNDVAFALAQGAKRVDAVEIDPGLQRVGRERHPDRPYDDPRVTVHITDGRAFLEQGDDQYDLILFALPDSLTLVSGQAALRLESYLFTLEAMEAVRDRMSPDGVFSMYNFYREDWLIDRLAGTLQAAFNRSPCVDTLGDVGKRAVLTIGASDSAVRCAEPWVAGPDVVSPSRDDYPFLYLREAQIPAFYLLAMGLILGAGAVMIRLAGGPFGSMTNYLDLFFMGAAFLLLETKSIVQFALLFGTTWFVNSVVFVGVLGSVFLAIEVTCRVRLPRPSLLYGALVLSVLLALIVPLHRLLGLPEVLRFLAAVVLWFTPIFIANLVFAQRFRSVGESNVAFGANLLGAVVGGVIEYTALMTGYTALAILVVILYGAAFVFGRKHMRGPMPA